MSDSSSLGLSTEFSGKCIPFQVGKLPLGAWNTAYSQRSVTSCLVYGLQMGAQTSFPKVILSVPCVTGARGALNHPVKARGPEALLQIWIKFAFIQLFPKYSRGRIWMGREGHDVCVLWGECGVVLLRELVGVALAPSINRLEKAMAVILVWLFLINSTAGEFKKKGKMKIKKSQATERLSGV